MVTKKTVLILVLLWASAAGNPPLARAQAGATITPVEERLFLLYAAEDLSRGLPRHVIEIGRLTEPPSLAWLRFQYRQRQVYDSVRRYLQKGKDDEILTLFQTYEKIGTLLDDRNQVLEKSCAAIYKQLLIEHVAAESRATLTGLGYALRSVAEGEDEATSILRGNSAMLAAFLEEEKQLGEARFKAAQKLNDIYATVDKEFQPRLKEAHEDFQKQLKNVAKANKFENPEFAFQVAADNATPARNPFLIVERGRAILMKKDASVKELLEQAEVCRTASGMVPKGNAYNVYRAAFLGSGALLASRAAEKDLGTTRLPKSAKDAPEGGKLALSLWAKYITYEPYDSAKYDDEVLSAYLLACAYAGDAKQAKTSVIEKIAFQPSKLKTGHPTVRRAASTRPEFWLTCARVCSVAGDAKMAYDCLLEAKHRGFRDSEFAKVCADLDTVRTDKETADKFKSMFK